MLDELPGVALRAARSAFDCPFLIKFDIPKVTFELKSCVTVLVECHVNLPLSHFTSNWEYAFT
jgi:hypothetical protein